MRKWFIMFLLLIVLCNCNDMTEEKLNVKNNGFFVYKIDDCTFARLEDNHSVECISENNVEYSCYNKSSNGENKVSITTFNNNEIYTEECYEGWGIAINNLPIFVELINFFESANGLLELFESSGYDVTVNDYTSFYIESKWFAEVPLTTVVRTNLGEFYVTTDISYDEKNTYKHKIFDKQAYFQQYGIKKGNLKINNVLIGETKSVIFAGNVAHISLSSVMNEIGVNYSYDLVNEKILLNHQGEKYELYGFDNPTLRCLDDNCVHELFEVLPGDSRARPCLIYDENVYINHETLEKLFEFIDVSVEIEVA